MSLAREFWDFMKARKKFMLAPVIVLLMIMSGMFVIGAAAPWAQGLIYSIW